VSSVKPIGRPGGGGHHLLVCGLQFLISEFGIGVDRSLTFLRQLKKVSMNYNVETTLCGGLESYDETPLHANSTINSFEVASSNRSCVTIRGFHRSKVLLRKHQCDETPSLRRLNRPSLQNIQPGDPPRPTYESSPDDERIVFKKVEQVIPTLMLCCF